MLDTTKTKGTAMPSPTSNRERDDNYHTVIYANESWRVIVSRCGIQWIIQRAAKNVNGRYWAGKSYCATRKVLIRTWHAKTGDYHGAVALGQLPERIGGKHGA